LISEAEWLNRGAALLTGTGHFTGHLAARADSLRAADHDEVPARRAAKPMIRSGGTQTPGDLGRKSGKRYQVSGRAAGDGEKLMEEREDGFGALVRRFRLAAGVTQEELAERAALSVRAIRRLERGQTTRPFQSSIRRLASALQLDDAATAVLIAAAPRRVGPAARGDAGFADSAERAGGVPRQLPARVRHFTGRTAELETLVSLLDQVGSTGGTVAISAIDGMAGVGKTALAVTAAHQLAGRFPDGQLFLDLHGYTPDRRPCQVEEALAMLLGALGADPGRVPPQAEARAALYRQHLADTRTLIVLDNVLDEAQVRPLLPAAPGCLVVITSRRRLKGLDDAYPLALDVLSGPEACTLLRAVAAPARIAADDPALAEVAERCGHLPLALRIAAALLRHRPAWTLQHLAALLRDRQLGVLSDGDRDLGLVFGLSYRHLTGPQQLLFRRLGLIPGPEADAHAAAALTGTAAGDAGLLLEDLVDHNLLTEHTPGRYQLHDLTRAYARQMADGDPQEQTAAIASLLDHYMYTAGNAVDIVYPSEIGRHPNRPPAASGAVPADADQPVALAWLTAEHANLLAAASYAAEHGWPRHAVGLAEVLSRHLDTIGRFPEARVLHRHAVHAAGELGDRRAEARALVWLGLTYGQQSLRREATTCYQRALEVARAAGDKDGQARALNYLGLDSGRNGRYREAIGQLEQTAVLFRETGEIAGMAYAITNLGVVHSRHGRYQEALACHQEAMAVFGELGNQHAQTTVLHRLGDTYRLLEEHEHAIGLYRQALGYYQDIGDMHGQADTLLKLGLVQISNHRYRQADEHLQRALTLVREMQDTGGQAEILNALGDLRWASGQHTAAAAHYTDALELAARLGERDVIARAHHGLGEVHHAAGDPRRAARHWAQAHVIYADLGSPDADRVKARLAGLPGDASLDTGLVGRQGVEP
jgi:tetratricopeptide (TPR) repeat protein/transcriptional regulator with XRE-family HTH domain